MSESMSAASCKEQNHRIIRVRKNLQIVSSSLQSDVGSDPDKLKYKKKEWLLDFYFFFFSQPDAEDFKKEPNFESL